MQESNTSHDTWMKVFNELESNAFKTPGTIEFGIATALRNRIFMRFFNI